MHNLFEVQENNDNSNNDNSNNNKNDNVNMTSQVPYIMVYSIYED